MVDFPSGWEKGETRGISRESQKSDQQHRVDVPGRWDKGRKQGGQVFGHQEREGRHR